MINYISDFYRMFFADFSNSLKGGCCCWTLSLLEAYLVIAAIITILQILLSSILTPVEIKDDVAA